MRLPGSELKRLFSLMLTSATPQCLCHKRAEQMDIMGTRWCRDSIEYIVDWLEEEADERKLFENDELKQRMQRFALRFTRAKRCLPSWVAKRIVRKSVDRTLQPGEARRILLRRIVLLCIQRAERGKPL